MSKEGQQLKLGKLIRCYIWKKILLQGKCATETNPRPLFTLEK